MQIETLDGVEMDWRPGSRKEKKYKQSKLQQLAVETILTVLPGTPILQEVDVPVYSNKKLRFDIYLPKHSIAVEVQGSQHSKTNPFFTTKQGFYRQQENDEMKELWCIHNDISLLIFQYNEKPETWIEKLKQALTNVLH